MSYTLKCSNCLRERPRSALFVNLHYAVCLDKDECNRWVVDKPLPPPPTAAAKGIAASNPGACMQCKREVSYRTEQGQLCELCHANHMRLLVRDAVDRADRVAYRTKRRGLVEVDDDPWDPTETNAPRLQDKLGPIGRKRRAS